MYRYKASIGPWIGIGKNQTNGENMTNCLSPAQEDKATSWPEDLSAWDRADIPLEVCPGTEIQTLFLGGR